MCLIIFAWKSHRKYDLIFAANRDEFYDRPAKKAAFWENHPDLLAGKDLRGGGTWLGVTLGGKFSAITNYRDLSKIKKNAPTRGRLPLNYLTMAYQPQEYLQAIRTDAARYNGYNLIAGNIDSLWYYSNVEDKPVNLPPGIYGLSNHLLDTPWHKVIRARRRFEEIIRKDEPEHEDLFRMLSDSTEASPEQLPDTGLDPETEKKVSPVFIRTDGYGTRSSTILLMGASGKIEFIEREFENGNNKPDGDHKFSFQSREE